MAKGKGVVQFDLSRVDMGDLEDFIQAMKDSKFRDAAGIMAKCCAACPAEWGAAGDASTFYKRPPVGEWAWKDVVGAMMEAVSAVGE